MIDNVIKCISFGSKSVTWTPLNRIAAIPSPTKEFMLKFSNFRESLAKPTKSVPVRYIRELLLKFCGLIPFSRVDFSLFYFKLPLLHLFECPTGAWDLRVHWTSRAKDIQIWELLVDTVDDCTNLPQIQNILSVLWVQIEREPNTRHPLPEALQYLSWAQNVSHKQHE